MASEHSTPPSDRLTVRVRTGVPVLDTGYTVVPNLLLDHYQALGLTEGTAFFVIRLLRQHARTSETRLDTPHARECVRELQERGLLSVRPWPDSVELHLGALFYNLTRLADWLAEGHSPNDFKIEIPTETPAGDGTPIDRIGSIDFEEEVADVLTAFALANQRPASPAEKTQLRNLAARFDAAARTADEASNGPAWVMAALRAALERKSQGNVTVSDLEHMLEQRVRGVTAVAPAGPTGSARREVMARVKRMSPQEKGALETVVMAYRGIAGQPPDDQLVLTLMQLSDKYTPTWVLNAIHETGKVQQLISPEYVESILIRWQSEGRIPGMPDIAESPPITDPLLARVVALYEQEVGPMSFQAGQQLAVLTEEFSDLDAWQHAFAEAAKSNVRNLRYVEAVLRKKGKKPTPPSRRPRSRQSAAREGVWSEEELEAARRRALSLPPVEIEPLQGEDTQAI